MRSSTDPRHTQRLHKYFEKLKHGPPRKKVRVWWGLVAAECPEPAHVYRLDGKRHT